MKNAVDTQPTEIKRSLLDQKLSFPVGRKDHYSSAAEKCPEMLALRKSLSPIVTSIATEQIPENERQLALEFVSNLKNKNIGHDLDLQAVQELCDLTCQSLGLSKISEKFLNQEIKELFNDKIKQA